MTDLYAQAEITDVIVSYSDAEDTRDWVRFRALFADDAVIDYTAAYGIAGGPDEITAWISGLMTREFVPDTMHAITNVRIEVTDDTALATAYFLNPNVMVAGEDEPYLLLNAGRYSFGLRRSDRGWLITRLVDEIMLSHRGDLDLFVLPDRG